MYELPVAPFVILAVLCAVGITIFLLTKLKGFGTLSSIQSKQTGHGQYGSARFAKKSEIRKIYSVIPFTPEAWRTDPSTRPRLSGIITGARFRGKKVRAYVDTGDVHALMIGAAGTGKTAYWLYPNLELACASGASFITTDTKGDLARAYAEIARKYYGYEISIIDLRNPQRSDGNNLLTLVNNYTDRYQKTKDPGDISRAETYAKIISKTIIMGGADSSAYGQNAYFYDASEGVLTASILLVSMFGQPGTRHIVSVYKLMQQLLEPADQTNGMNRFQELMTHLPDDHKIKWFAGAALSGSEQTIGSVMSTALSRLSKFLDSEMENILCRDGNMNAELMERRKCAMFIIMPEEDNSRYFMVSLLIQQLSRELLMLADRHGGRLSKRVMFFCDEFGTLPQISSAEMMFSASRSRGITLVPIIQSFAQLEKNYGREGAEIIVDNIQLTIFGGLAPHSSSTEKLSRSLGSQTVQSGTVNKGEKQGSMSLSMISRPLLTTDELLRLDKGTFVVEKTGQLPILTNFKLYKNWGITLGKSMKVSSHTEPVIYADYTDIRKQVLKCYDPFEDYNKSVHHGFPKKHTGWTNK
ncbi:MAG: type IV secretory system conjugative DNA transfer family protein [Clostridia bacterium]|nr:type IV secretory system conjugative DNA transfer family protein [Clostridia bacterium]